MADRQLVLMSTQCRLVMMAETTPAHCPFDHAALGSTLFGLSIAQPLPQFRQFPLIQPRGGKLLGNR